MRGPCPHSQTCGPVAAGRLRVRPRAPAGAPPRNPATLGSPPAAASLALAAAPALKPANAPGTSAEAPAARGPEAAAATAAAPRALLPGRWGGFGGRPHPSPPPAPPPPEAAPLPATPTVGGPGAGDTAGTSLTRPWLWPAERTSPPPGPSPTSSATSATPLGRVPALALVRRWRRRGRGGAARTRQVPPPCAPALAPGRAGWAPRARPLAVSAFLQDPPLEGWSDAPSVSRKPHPRASIALPAFSARIPDRRVAV